MRFELTDKLELFADGVSLGIMASVDASVLVAHDAWLADYFSHNKGEIDSTIAVKQAEIAAINDLVLQTADVVVKAHFQELADSVAVTITKIDAAKLADAVVSGAIEAAVPIDDVIVDDSK